MLIRTFLLVVSWLNCMLALPPTSEAQSLVHTWSHHFGDPSYQFARSVATDFLGNVIITGEFQGTTNFGGGPLTSAGHYDIFLAKFDAAGNHLWSQRFGDASVQVAQGVSTDAWGNVIVTGGFASTVDFGGGPLTSAGAGDMFVAKFDAAGNHVWSRRFGDSATQNGYSVATDGAGNVVVTGEFAGTVDLGGGGLTTAGSTDILLASFDAAGNHLWSQRFGDTDIEHPRGVTTDGAGNVIVAGRFRGNVDFGGGPLASASAGTFDIFVAKFDAAGNHVWSQRFGDAAQHYAQGVAVDDSANVILTGYFQSDVDFGGGVLTSAGDFDAYVAKFDAAGNHVWSQRFGDAGEQYAYGIAADGSGNLAVTGYYRSSVDFGGGPMTSAGLDDIFVARFDGSGNHLWSQRFGDGLHQESYGVATDSLGNVLVTGHIDGTVDFGGGGLASAGNFDIFLAKYSNATATGIGDEQSRVPTTYKLDQNFPNPFNPTTTIRYELPEQTTLFLAVYDVRGARVRDLVDGTKPAGTHDAVWDGRNTSGDVVASGIYYCRMRAGTVIRTRKLVFLK